MDACGWWVNVNWDIFFIIFQVFKIKTIVPWYIVVVLFQSSLAGAYLYSVRYKLSFVYGR